MLRAIAQSGTRTGVSVPGSLSNALRLTGISGPAAMRTPLTTLSITAIAQSNVAVPGFSRALSTSSASRGLGSLISSALSKPSPRLFQPSVISSAASRGIFTTTTGVGAGAGVSGQVRRLTFQELRHHTRLTPATTTRKFNSSSIRHANALTRFAGNNFSVDSSNKVVYSIVALNVSVFGVWQYAEGNAKRFHDGRLYMFMFRNFTDSLQNLKEGRVWTLVTSAFSHKEWYHILLNTMVLLSFGDPVWRLLGTRRFLAVYLGSAISASLSSIVYYASLEPYLRRMQHKPANNSVHYSMGASGSIMGITTAFACVYPMSQYSLFFVITMPAAALIGLFGAYELYNVLAANTGRFDSAGHLGGGLFGAAYYFTKLRPLIRR
ncbi:hypothetical protein BGX23_012554 [Mortierella sp. AD031]|nr:hypothetical protein BGX23_012554 [Mortierella sp. AD031]